MITQLDIVSQLGQLGQFVSWVSLSVGSDQNEPEGDGVARS